MLLVDDSPTMRARLEIDLVAAGFEVHMAEDGRAGIDRLAEASYDAVVSDVQMPRLDGFGLLTACGDGTARDPDDGLRGRRGRTPSPQHRSAGYLAKDENIGKAVIECLARTSPAFGRPVMSINVLVVDDSATVRHKLNAELTEAGMNVAEARTVARPSSGSGPGTSSTWSSPT